MRFLLRRQRRIASPQRNEEGERCLPFLELWGGDQASKVSRVILHSALPPVGILLVDDPNDVTCLKLEAGLLAGDEVIHGGVIVKLGPHVHLWMESTCLFYIQPSSASGAFLNPQRRQFRQNMSRQVGENTGEPLLIIMNINMSSFPVIPATK